MNDYRVIEDLIGQSEVIRKITHDYSVSARYLITAPSGGGKHYLVNQLKGFFLTKPNLQIIHCHIKISGLDSRFDFAPFITMLSNEEKVSQANAQNLGKTFVEVVPYVGKCISQLLSLKKVYPTIFNSTESELLARMERLVGHKNPVFFCEEIDTWDRASICFLQKLMSKAFPTKACIFICTASSSKSEISISMEQLDQLFDLQPIPDKQIQTVVQKLFPRSNFPPDVLQQIQKLSGGNIGIVIQLINLMEENGDTLSHGDQYQEIILYRLQEALGELRYDNAVELLNRASLIGERVYRKLLAHFVQFDSATFIESIDDVVSYNIMMDEIDFLAFSYHAIWQSFKENNKKNKRFHLELAKCICELMPSNYTYIADEMLKAGENREAAIFYILSAIKEYHTYRSLPILPESQRELLHKCNLITAYQNLISLYESVINGDYCGAQNAMYHFSEPRLLFEADYIRAVGKINGSIMQSTYSEALTTLQSWVEDDGFYRQSPYQWMRAALLAVGAQYELHDQDMFDLLKKIDRTKRKFASTDRGIELLDYDFLSKCNYCYSIDTAYLYTKEALKFFRDNLDHSPSRFPYYIALINCGANSTVMGKFQEAMELLTEAIVLLEQEPFSHGITSSLVNNLLIAELLGGQMNGKEEIQLAVDQMNDLIQAKSDDIISSILLRNNQIIMLCYQGDFVSAANQIEILYNEICYIEGVDDYYPYIVGNNYYIIRHLAEIEPLDQADLEKVFCLRPLDHDHDYFATRQRIILEQISNSVHFDLLAPNWNDLPGPFVGPAWNFWGKWLLFSDLQIWSN
ncbi:MAG: hypothetical protein HFF06_01780 [Oscillospiraceae bacterium]|nr:hypothetical protein [Oscillospiraceae bacterium]